MAEDVGDDEKGFQMQLAGYSVVEFINDIEKLFPISANSISSEYLR